jgi:small conductance mechanosensitive channel
MREFQRRVRLALEENHMLPGDPNRVFSSFTAKATETQQGSAVLEEHHETPKADPTTNKAHDVNPFNPE